MGGTKWNKGGTSKGTYGPMGWDLFAIQILPSVGSRGAENGQKCAFLAISSSGVGIMIKAMINIDHT